MEMQWKCYRYRYLAAWRQLLHAYSPLKVDISRGTENSMGQFHKT